MSKKQTYLILFLLITVVFTINLISFKNGHPWGDDYAAYIAQTKAIIYGNFDELISINKYRFENSPSTGGPVLAPWGFPILLIPVYYAFGSDIHAMKIFVYLFFLASLVIAFFLFKDRLTNIENLLLLALIAFNPFFFTFKDTVHPDIPFLFFSLISLLFIERFVVSRKIWKNTIFSYSLIGFFIFISVEIRSIGFVLLPTLLVAQFIESKSSIKKIWFDKFNFIPYLIFLVFYIANSVILPNIDLYSYFMQGKTMGMILIQLVKSFKRYIFLPSQFIFSDLDISNIFNYETNLIHLFYYCTALFFVVWGMIINLKKDYIFSVYVVLTLTILILNPASQGVRYIIPIFPFFLYFLFIGLSKTTLSLLMSNKQKYLKINAVYLFSAALLIISFVQIQHNTYRNIIFNKTEVMQGPYTADSIEFFDYIKKNIDINAVIDFRKPRAMSLYTDRRSIITLSLEQLLNSPADYTTYIKDIPWWYKYDVEYLKNNFNCIFENKTFILCKMPEKLPNH